jgi:long-chain acyl-CoA synthetase
MPIPNADLHKLYPLPKLYDETIASTEAPGFTTVDGETIPRRNHKAPQELLWKPHPEISTVHEILTYAAKRYGNAKSMGSRKLVKMHKESKMVKKVVDGEETEVEKKWEYFEMSGYTYQTFTEFEKLSYQIGFGLRKLGLVAGDKLHLFAATQYVFQSTWTILNTNNIV